MKKILSLALTLALAVSLCIPAWAGFADVSGWAEPYINRASELGLVSGIGGGKFGPNQNVTYGQLATMLVNLKWAGEVDAARADGYDSAWWEPYCRVASLHGLFDNTEMSDYLAWDFVAGEPVDRTGMAVMVYNFVRAGGGAEISASELAAAKGSITDIGHLYTDHADAVAYCYAANLLSGTGDGTFSPDSNMTRAQAATVLCSVHSSITGGTSSPTTPDQPQQPAGGERPADAIGGQYDISVYTVPADANKDGWLTQAEVEARIEELKVQYPQGTLWNDATVWGNDQAAADGYVKSSGLHRYSSKAFGNGTGCAAWAFMLSDRIFGNLPRREFTDAYSMRSGDVVWDQSTPHWMVYLNPSPYNSNYVQMSESGSEPNSKISWNSYSTSLTFADEQDAVDAGTAKLYTRYPAE